MRICFSSRGSEKKLLMINDQQYEEYVIGYLIIGSNDTVEVCSQLREEYFYDVRIATTFRAITELLEQGVKPDFLTIESQLRLYHPNSNVTQELLANWMCTENVGDIQSAITVLRHFLARRQLLNIAKLIQYKAPMFTFPTEELINEVQSELDLIDLSPMKSGESLSQVADRVEQRMLENLDPKTRHTFPICGIELIDQEAPLPESGLVVLGGASSSGKSSMANQIVLQSVRMGMKVAYLSKEMPNVDTVGRMVAMGTDNVAANWIMDQPLLSVCLEEARRSLKKLKEECGESVFFDDSRSQQFTDVTTAIRRLHKEHGIRLAVVDYLQLLTYDSTLNRHTTQEQLMGYYSRVLKNLGDQLGITIIAISQFNRTQPQIRPTNACLRDSGQIAEAADYILLLWRPERTNGSYDGEYEHCNTKGTALLIVDKNRRGPTLSTLIGWKAQTTKFYELSSEQIEQLKTGHKLTHNDLQQTIFK